MSANAQRMYWQAPLTMARHLDATEKVYAEALAAARGR